MKPEKRQRKKPKKLELSLRKWTVDETQTLYEAIIKYGYDDYEKLQKDLPHRHVDEIEEYLKKIKYRGEAKHIAKDVGLDDMSPIEQWLASSIAILKDEMDYSSAIAQAFSMAGNLEPHLPKHTGNSVNYPLLYQYIVCLMRKEEPPQLSPLESAVMAEILESMSKEMLALDLDQIKALLNHKSAILNTTVHVKNTERLEELYEEFNRDPFELKPPATMNQSCTNSASSQQASSVSSSSTTNGNTVAMADNMRPKSAGTSANVANGNVHIASTSNATAGNVTVVPSGSATSSDVASGTPATGKTINVVVGAPVGGMVTANINLHVEGQNVGASSGTPASCVPPATASRHVAINASTSSATDNVVPSTSGIHSARKPKPPKSHYSSLNPFNIPIKYLNPYLKAKLIKAKRMSSIRKNVSHTQQSLCLATGASEPVEPAMEVSDGESDEILTEESASTPGKSISITKKSVSAKRALCEDDKTENNDNLQDSQKQAAKEPVTCEPPAKKRKPLYSVSSPEKPTRSIRVYKRQTHAELQEALQIRHKNPLPYYERMQRNRPKLVQPHGIITDPLVVSDGENIMVPEIIPHEDGKDTSSETVSTTSNLSLSEQVKNNCPKKYVPARIMQIPTSDGGVIPGILSTNADPSNRKVRQFNLSAVVAAQFSVHSAKKETDQLQQKVTVVRRCDIKSFSKDTLLKSSNSKVSAKQRGATEVQCSMQDKSTEISMNNTADSNVRQEQTCDSERNVENSAIHVSVHAAKKTPEPSQKCVSVIRRCDVRSFQNAKFTKESADSRVVLDKQMGASDVLQSAQCGKADRTLTKDTAGVNVQDEQTDDSESNVEEETTITLTLGEIFPPTAKESV